MNPILRSSSFLLFCFLISIGNAQEQYTLSGVVTDASSGELLIQATVKVANAPIGVVTNNYGFYSLTLDEGSYTLSVSYLGFRTHTHSVTISADQKMNFSLRPDQRQLDEVVLTTDTQTHSQVRNPLMGVSRLRTEEIKSLPALFGEADVTRAILTQPGISSVGEGATGFNVRGGNIDQNLILLDEAPVYNSSHLWGFFSVFNADAIKKVELYKGGIPARYGGRASSVLDVRQREGNLKRFSGTGGLGLLFSRLTLEGPIVKDKLSFLVSGRRSYFDLVFSSLPDLENTRVYFYDTSTKLTWLIDENNRLYASGYFGADVLRFSFEGGTLMDGTQEADEAIDFRWRNSTTTLRWNRIFSDKLFMNFSGIYSQYHYRLNSENDAGDGPANTTGTFVWRSTIENWVIKPDFTWYNNAYNTFRFGFNGTLYRFTPASVTSTETGINAVDFPVERGLEWAPYIEWERENEAWSLIAGLRYAWFGYMGPYDVRRYDPDKPKDFDSVTEIESFERGDVIKSHTGLEPRLALSYRLGSHSKLKAGYNRMVQYVQMISNTTAALPFDVWKPAGPHIEPLEVDQLSAGVAWDSKDARYNFSVEGFYKSFRNLIEYRNGADLFLNDQLETQLISADGRACGLELSVHKVKGILTGNLNYTYAVSERHTISPFSERNIRNGDDYPSNYDKPHTLNATANLKLGQKWKLNGVFTYQTGRPITSALGRYKIGGNDFILYSQRNAHRLPDSHRLDLSVEFTPQKSRGLWKGTWRWGIYNIYGHKNVFSQFTNFYQGDARTYQFSVIGSPIPFITYNFKF